MNNKRIAALLRVYCGRRAASSGGSCRCWPRGSRDLSAGTAVRYRTYLGESYEMAISGLDRVMRWADAIEELHADGEQELRQAQSALMTELRDHAIALKAQLSEELIRLGGL